ncbi:MAG: nitrite reductase small subunit NirD [Cyclobacteriaceae bacterium]
MTEELIAYKTVKKEEVKVWHKVGSTTDFSENGGQAVLYKGMQIAVFNFTRRGEWYATQNQCPHKNQMILSRGMIGSDGAEPKVSCPFHKNTFSLKSGKALNSDNCDLATYPVKIENGYVYVGFED